MLIVGHFLNSLAVSARESGYDTLISVTTTINLYQDSARQSLLIGDLPQALEYIRKSHAIVSDVYNHDSEEYINSLVNIGVVFTNNWDYDSALIYIRRAENIQLGNTTQNNSLNGKIYYNLGRIFLSLGDYTRARDYFLRSVSLFLRYTDRTNMSRLSSVYSQLGILEIRQGNYTDAIEIYKKNYRMVNKLNENKFFDISNLMGHAWAVSEMGDYQESIKLQMLAVRICHSDSARFIIYLATLYNNIAVDYMMLNEFTKAKEYLDKSHTAYLTVRSSDDRMAQLYDSFGSLYMKSGEFDLAVRYFQQALTAISSDFNDLEFAKNPEPAQINEKVSALKILKNKADALTKQFGQRKDLIYLEQAIVTSQVAISLIEELRNSYLSHESKLQIAEQENETFRNALSQCYLAYTATNDPKYARLGFEVSEKSKSAILLSYLRELDARNFGGIPEAYLNEENYLSKRIAYYKENLYEESKEESPDSIKIKNWNNYLFEYIRDHEKLLTNLEERYPQYYKLKYDNEVVNISDFQGGLKRNATLVEYALVDSVLYTYVVSKNRYELLSQKLSPVFFDALHDYLKVYQSFDFSKQSYTGFTEFIWNSKTLYDYLIRPAEKYMTGEEMIIVPDGILSYLPFETLINEVPNEIPRDYYRNLNYLINQYAISYSFSSTLYYQVMKQTGKGSRREVLAFAPEYSGNNYAKTPESMITRQQYRKNLFPIPGVAEEIETLEKILPTDVYLGKEASETNFLRLASQYDLLHLAMHTVIDNHNPMFSKLIFSPGADSLNDGLLNTHEIFGLDLKARMVVLSACSTGEGDISTGEGVMSLARGFVYAGSPSLVMTLWEVEDRSGIVLMKNFYLNLLKGMNKPQALRKAKIDFIREMKPENTHPFFWSSYVVLGNTQPIFHRSRLLYGLSIIFLLFLVSGIFFRKKIFMRRG